MKNSSQTNEINHKTGILTAYIEKDSKNSSRKSTKNTKRKNFVKIKQHKKKLRSALPYHLWRRRRDSFLLSSKQLRRIKVCAFRIASVTAKNSSQDCFLDAFVRISPTHKMLSKIKRCPIGHPFILAEKEERFAW